MNRPRARAVLSALGVALLCTGFLQPIALSPVSAAAGERLALVPLTIRSGKAEHRFKVELAVTPAQQARGLMYRTSIPRDGGMFFPFPWPRPASFWMKNTLVPLDILFIRDDGTIARIASETTPLSLAPIESGEPVRAVLELRGGRAAALGITAGDKLVWPAGTPSLP